MTENYPVAVDDVAYWTSHFGNGGFWWAIADGVDEAWLWSVAAHQHRAAFTW